jgi:hypothetical protein
MQIKRNVKTERDHAIYARSEDGLKTVKHGVQSIVYAIDESRRY